MNRLPLPHARRFLVVDAGSRRLKALLVSAPFGRIHVHAQRVAELDETNPPGSPGWTRLLHGLAAELGAHPLAITVPQHLTDSQVLDLPEADAPAIREHIQGDVVKLSGLTESAILYDFGPLRPFAQYSNPYWITHAREAEVLDAVRQFSDLSRDVWEISSPGNALVAAHRELQPSPGNALLVDIGASATVVAIVHEGQGVFVTSYPVGGSLFHEHLAAETGDEESASRFDGPGAPPALVRLVDRWHEELSRILDDWLREHPALGLTADRFEVVLSGGTADLPGFLGHLRSRKGLRIARWTDLPGAAALPLTGQYAVAYGLACQLLRPAGPSASLVPEEMRAVRKEQQTVHLLQAGAWFLVAAIALVLGFGTWIKHRQISAVEEQIVRADSIIERARRAEELRLRLAAEHEELRPVLAGQRHSLAALRTLALLARQPAPTNAWFVLFADADSYYAAPVLPAPTNAPPTAVPTNALARLTNGFVAEFSTPLDPSAARAALSGMIDGYKQARFFSKVDILSDDQRRRLVPDAVVVPQGHYALSFTPDETEFPLPVLSADDLRRLGPAARPAVGGGPRRPGQP